MSTPSDIITVTLAGKTFRTCRFCAAHIEWTIERLAADKPGKALRIIQPSWNAGVAASEGTHDKCACFDVEIVGMDIHVANKWLRNHGWWGWVRSPAQGFAWHIHTISAGCPAPKGRFVDGAGGTTSSQLDDYKRHALGLAGQHSSNGDPECWGNPHAFVVFDYPRYLREKWFEMASREDLRAELAPIENKLTLLTERTEGLRVTLAGIVTDLDALEVEVADDATKDLVRKMRDQIIAAIPV